MPQCGRKTLDLNIILMRATNPRKAIKCGIYHTRVLVAVYSFFMNPQDIDIIVGCEESQAITIEFRKLGFNAFSCDTQECSGGHPEWHLQMDVLEALKLRKWKMGIFHPPCTFMSRAGARFMFPKAGIIDNGRLAKALEAKELFMKCLNADIKYIVVENPIPLKVVGLPKPDCYVQPFEHGHPFSKKTLLWLKNLPPIMPTKIISEYTPYLPSNTGGAKRGQKATFRNISQKDSSKTFPGIAQAIATQYGSFLLNGY